MIQCCDVYINIMCNEEDKVNISALLKEYFSYVEHNRLYNIDINYIDIIDDANGLIVLDLEIDVPCSYIGGYPGTRWEPPEPAYIDGYLDEEDFLDCIKGIISKDFDVEIEIDSDSSIPNE